MTRDSIDNSPTRSMRRNAAPPLALLAALAMLAVTPAARAELGTLSVSGGQISGTVENGVSTYKGIPYAEPPVGELRWTEPQPVRDWDGVRACDAVSSICPQVPYPALSLYARPPEPNSEDCLYLNVWSAAESADESRPVMVWIHGGALTRGSGGRSTYNGQAFAKQGVILVTINYRVNVFGFLAHPELTEESPNHSSGNYGILDQIAALEWVRDNIAAFGGDPDNVTIFGESAGSWSVNCLQATPLAKGLFDRVIGQSGASFGPMARLSDSTGDLPSAEQSGIEFAAAAGARSIEDLRRMSWEKILETFAADPSIRTRPNVDGWMLPDEIRAIFAAGKQNDVPILIGSNANEMTSLTYPSMIPRTLEALGEWIAETYPGAEDAFARAYPAETDADAAGAWLDCARDRVFTLGMRTWARAQASGTAPAYLYFFNHTAPSPMPDFYGAYHASEIAYVFGNLHTLSLPHEEADATLSAIMNSAWVSFARSGDPNGEGIAEWAAYDAESEAYMEFGDEAEAGNHLLKEQLDLVQAQMEEGS